MKTNLSVTALAAAVTSLVALACAACGPPHRGDWRAPTAAVPCTTDADCNGGVCGADPASTPGQPVQGACSQAPLTPLPGADGGAPPARPAAPLVQPSSTDIQI